MAAHASAVHADDLLYQCSIFLERQLMPMQYIQMTLYIYVAYPGTEAHDSAVNADDLLYLCSILLERQLTPVQCMQMTFYIYVASFWNGSSCQCSTCR
jgi:hypothetical protein